MPAKEATARIKINKLRFLRPYQLKAIHALQQTVEEYRAFLSKYGIEYDERYVWD